jgi:phosphoribosylformylglycinamidine (FGAM) synthase PurS component
VTSATIKNGEMLEIAARVICDALIQIRFSHVDEMSHTRRLTFELTGDRQAAKQLLGVRFVRPR